MHTAYKWFHHAASCVAKIILKHGSLIGQLLKDAYHHTTVTVWQILYTSFQQDCIVWVIFIFGNRGHNIKGGVDSVIQLQIVTVRGGVLGPILQSWV